MKKFVFWSTRHAGKDIVLTEDLGRYAQGKTAWEALFFLAETLKTWQPATDTTESDFNQRLKMYQETGLNKIEIFLEYLDGKYAVRSTGVRSAIKADSEQHALLKYLELMAANSLENENGQMGM